MSYTPESVPSLEDLPRYIEQELNRIAGILQTGQFNMLLIETLHREPSRTRENMIVAADGTDWDPGSGQGIYAYYGAAWHKLG